MPVVIFNKNSAYDASWCDEIVNVMRPNVLGNPFPISGRNTRDFVIRSYRDWITVKLDDKESLQSKEIGRLRDFYHSGKSIALICCCTPMPCHADIIKEIIEEPRAEIKLDPAKEHLA